MFFKLDISLISFSNRLSEINCVSGSRNEMYVIILFPKDSSFKFVNFIMLEKFEILLFPRFKIVKFDNFSRGETLTILLLYRFKVLRFAIVSRQDMSSI